MSDGGGNGDGRALLCFDSAKKPNNAQCSKVSLLSTRFDASFNGKNSQATHPT